MVNTITSIYAATVTLSLPAEIETVIAAGAQLLEGLYGSNANPWTITNNGFVRSTTLAAIDLAAGGTITNVANRRISGKLNGIEISGGTGLVVNAGTISSGAGGAGVVLTHGTVTNLSTGTIVGSHGITASAAATVTNAGTIQSSLSGTGIILTGGGNVINQSTGRIAGQYGISGGIDGPLTVNNAGTIDAVEAAILMKGGGTVTNQASGVLQGTYGGVILGTGSATVTNAGLIGGNQMGVGAFDGGLIQNEATGTISGGTGVVGNGVVIDNTGLIMGTGTYAAALALYNVSSVTNRAGGTITGEYAILFTGVGVVVDNAGVIAGGSYYGMGGISTVNEASITNRAGGTISGRTGIQSGAGPITLANAGVVAGDTAGPQSAGIFLGTGGTITNEVGGSITGYFGLYALHTGGEVLSISNAGLISGQSDCGCGHGIYLLGEGTITNFASGTIRGSSAVFAEYGAYLTVSNAGTIAGNATYATGHGIWAYADSDITNLAGGVISGYTGVGLFSTGNTLHNSGTIIGSGGTAVAFGADQTNLLGIGAGAVFTGLVDGGNGYGASGISTMLLTSSASVGTLTGLGTDFINFTGIEIDSGARWAFTGNNTIAAYTSLTNYSSLTLLGGTLSAAGQITNNGTIRLSPATMSVEDILGTGRVVIGGGALLETAGTIDAGQSIVFGAGDAELSITPDGFSGLLVNFYAGDTIDLRGITDVLSASIISPGTLTIDRDTAPDISLRLDPSIDYSTANFFVTNELDGDFITTDIACFAAGTRLDTPDGPVTVERLAEGDLVLTAAGPARRVKWIGWRHLDLRRHPDPTAVQPIEIAAEAIAPGVPARIVRLSPEHAVALDDMLIPVRLLANGTTIRQDATCRSVTYYHVELDSHDLLLAEGMAAESYLDTGNRSVFANAGASLTLHPDFGAGNDQARRDTESCLPFVTEPDRVCPVWRRLAGSVAMPEVQTTDDPDLRVQVDGRVLRPVSVHAGVHVFAIPTRSGAVRLLSRAGAPHAVQPWNSDRRALGVAVRNITVRQGGAMMVLPPDHPGLTDGWWAVERDATTLWRWTNGDAELPLEPGGPSMLEIRIGASPLYLAQAA